VCGSSGSIQLRPRGGPSEMISDGCTDTNRKVLVEGVGENLLPTAQTWGFGRPCLPVAAPCTGNRHIDLFCDLRPGQALGHAAPESAGWRRDETEDRPNAS
jgi:hypothetical protein